MRYNARHDPIYFEQDDGEVCICGGRLSINPVVYIIHVGAKISFAILN